MDKAGGNGPRIETKRGHERETELFEVTRTLAGRKRRNPQKRRRKIREGYLEYHGEKKQFLTSGKH